MTRISLSSPFGHDDELSADAMTLLKAGAKNQGSIWKLPMLGGPRIQAGDGNAFGGGHPREFARWEHALNELVSAGLVAAKGHKGELYDLTHLGWTLAESLAD